MGRVRRGHRAGRGGSWNGQVLARPGSRSHRGRRHVRRIPGQRARHRRRRGGANGSARRSFRRARLVGIPASSSHGVLHADPLLVQAIERAGARPADVATTLAITVDDALAREAASVAGCEVEHLEAFGIAAACAQAGVPFGAVLAVANVVGGDARSEWRANHRAAEAAAAAVVRRWLDCRQPG